VEIHYVEEPVSDYLQAAVNTVLLIHEKVVYFLLFNGNLDVIWAIMCDTFDDL